MRKYSYGLGPAVQVQLDSLVRDLQVAQAVPVALFSLNVQRTTTHCRTSRVAGVRTLSEGTTQLLGGMGAVATIS